MNPISQTVNIKRKRANQAQVILRKLVPDFYSVIWKLQVLLSDIFSIDIIYDYVCYIGNIKFSKFFGLFFELLSVIEFQSKSGSQSPAEVAKSNKQWVGTCLY